MMTALRKWLSPQPVQASSTSSPASWFVTWIRGGNETQAGITVNTTKALTHSAVWACVRLRAESLASLPLKLYRRQNDGGKVEERNGGLWRLLHDKPNANMNSFEFRCFMQACLDLWGNAYAIKHWQGGNLISLEPVTPSRVQIQRDGSRVQYEIRLSDPERKVTLNAENVLHIRNTPNLSDDGLSGMSVIAQHRETFGGALARREYGNRFFGNGASPGGILKYPGSLTAEQKSEMRRSWESLHQGTENSSKLAVLDQGLEYQSVHIPNEDSQWLESQSFDIADIARIFNVPSPLINDHQHSTFSNVEQLTLNFRVHTLHPLCRLWTAALNDQCLVTPQQRNTLFFEHVIEDLLSADLEAKSAFLKEMFFNGFMSRNEIRGKLNLNPVEGGDRFYLQSAMAPIGDDGSLDMPEPAAAEPSPEEESADVVEMQPAANANALALLQRKCVQAVDVEARKCRKAGKKPDQFLNWLELFSDDEKLQFADYLADYLSVAGVDLEAAQTAIDGHCERSADMLLDLSGSATKAQLAGQVDEMVTGWPESRGKELFDAICSAQLQAASPAPA